MPLFVALKTESSFETVFSLFWSKFLQDSDYINVHGIGVLGRSGGGGESVISTKSR